MMSGSLIPFAIEVATGLLVEIREVIVNDLNKLTAIYLPSSPLFRQRPLPVDAIELGVRDENEIDFFIYAQDVRIAVDITDRLHLFDHELLTQLPDTTAVLELRVEDFLAEFLNVQTDEYGELLLELLTNTITGKYWRRPSERCELPHRGQFQYFCISCGTSWQGHRFNNLCDSCKSPLLVLQEPLS